MPRPFHLQQDVNRHPQGWVRWVALLCVLLFGTVSTAQAAHLHQPARQGHHLQGPAAGNLQNTSDTAEHCPLCVAIQHSVLPPPMLVVLAPALVFQPAVPAVPACGTASSWSFARFSRPPPALA